MKDETEGEIRIYGAQYVSETLMNALLELDTGI